MQLLCAVLTSKKFTVQLSALLFRPDGSLLVNISGGRGQFPATPGGVQRLDIPVSYGVEIPTDDNFVLSQYTHLTDGQTEGQNCDSNTVHCITSSRTLKNGCN